MKTFTHNVAYLLTAAAILSAATGCGKNAHVTAGDAANSETASAPLAETAVEPQIVALASPTPAPESLVAETTPKATESAPQPGPGPGPVGPNGPAGKDGPGGPDGLAGNPSTPESTLILVKGDKGDKGDKGESAKCGIESRGLDGGIVRAINPAELQALRAQNGDKFPYVLRLDPKEKLSPRAQRELKATKRAEQPHMGLLSLDGSNRTITTGLLKGTPFVTNAEVIFVIEVPLPARDTILVDRGVSAVLTLNAYKHSVDQFLDTELICLLDQEVCSGKEFSAAFWKTFTNNRFGGGSPIVNDYFSKQILEGIQSPDKDRRKPRNDFEALMSLDLATLFAKGGQPLGTNEVLDLLYKGTDPLVAGTRNLFVLVADDVLVRKTASHLDFTYFVDTCASTGAAAGE